MKVLLVSKRPELLRSTVESEGHTIIGALNSPDGLATVIIALAPHFVLIDKQVVPSGLLEMAMPSFPLVRFASFDFVGYHSARLAREAFGNPKLDASAPLIPESRQSIFDQRYLPYFASDPLDCSSVQLDLLDVEADLRRLADLYNTTRHRQETFEQRLNDLRFIEEFENGEIGVHIIRGDIQAPADTREQVSRYLAVLAHSVPSVEIDCLPHPRDPAPGYHYVHYVAGLETRYAIACVATFGCNLQAIDALLGMIDWHFKGEKRGTVTNISLHLAGLLFLTRQVANAHATVMSWLLNRQLPAPFTAVHRNVLKIFSDFWTFSSRLADPNIFQRFIDEAETYEKQEIYFPGELSFQKFVRFTEKNKKGRQK